MPPRLFAFDLDGTLLTSDKRLSAANKAALEDMECCGATVVLASGRLGSSMLQYANGLDCHPALLTLNGAAVYTGNDRGAVLIHEAPLAAVYGDALISRSEHREFAINYYIDGMLYTVRNDKTAKWNDLYYAQTSSQYHLLDSMRDMQGRSPLKIIFVGDPAELDKEEADLRRWWDGEIYIVRTWDYYLEFMSPRADKGKGLIALAAAYGIHPKDTVAFGDANNDIPLFAAAHTSIALRNASAEAKAAASRVSKWTNDEDAVAREWKLLKER